MDKQLSTKIFIICHIAILIAGLIFLAGFYYLINIQYQSAKGPYSSPGRPVTTKPATLTLQLNSPDDNTLTFEPSLLVSGITSPNLEVLINSDSQNLVVKAQADGSFTAEFDLTEGINNLSVTVFDQTGDQKTIDRTLYYSKEKI